jgi:hypothetical protein
MHMYQNQHIITDVKTLFYYDSTAITTKKKHNNNNNKYINIQDYTFIWKQVTYTWHKYTNNILITIKQGTLINNNNKRILFLFYFNLRGHAIAQVVSHRLPTAMARVQA